MTQIDSDERAELLAAELAEARTEIAELKRRVEAAEQRLTSIDAAPDAIFSLTPDGRYAYANQALADAHGRAVEDVPGKSLWDFFPKEEAERRFASLRQVFRTGEHVTVEGPVGQAGSVRHFATAMRPIKDAVGNVVSTICTSRDVTESKRSEEALRESEGFLRETQRVANLGSYVMSPSTGSWRSSDVLDGIFGIGGAYERSVEGWANLIHPEDRAMMLDYFSNDVLGLAHAFDKEYRIVRHDNRVERWVHGLGTVQFDADGRPLWMHGTIQDITERRRAEEERGKLEAQLYQARKMESVGQLAGGVAHDFNNMLGVILGNLEAAMEQVEPTSALHEDLEEIRKAAARSADLTRQLLAFARKGVYTPKVLDLNDTVAAMLKLLERLIGEDIALRWVPGAGSCQVNMDPSQLDQILANLCVNARDAISGVGKLTIETGNVTLDEDYCAAHEGAVPGDYIRLAVSDDGCGMDDETQARIFEPFFTTKETGKGTGLGLATVYGIVKQNHGSIEVYSEPGHGTTFRIYVPRHLDTAKERARASAPPVPHGHETILLVEDEAGILRMTSRMLERLGYSVLTAGGPGDAIRLANEHPGEIHLLMTDVVMPKMNGRDLATDLQSRHPGMKVLFMSGYTADVIDSHGVLDKEVHFIQKPFSNQDLAAKAREVLDGG